MADYKSIAVDKSRGKLKAEQNVIHKEHKTSRSHCSIKSKE
ncbi:hypothetical protein [Clostridium estertheticum]|nr:hypothetical protein [Clostridium estertheticum]